MEGYRDSKDCLCYKKLSQGGMAGKGPMEALCSAHGTATVPKSTLAFLSNSRRSLRWLIRSSPCRAQPFVLLGGSDLFMAQRSYQAGRRQGTPSYRQIGRCLSAASITVS